MLWNSNVIHKTNSCFITTHKTDNPSWGRFTYHKEISPEHKMTAAERRRQRREKLSGSDAGMSLPDDILRVSSIFRGLQDSRSIAAAILLYTLRSTLCICVPGVLLFVRRDKRRKN